MVETGLLIYGASDDIVEIEGHVREEVGCYGQGVSVEVGDAKGGIRVVARYAPGKAAVWRMGIEPIDEDVPIPWSVSVRLAARGYSPLITIDCPAGTPVRVRKVKAKVRHA